MKKLIARMRMMIIMRSIEKFGEIYRFNLSEEFYVQSLLEIAVQKNILTLEELEIIQVQCIQLLNSQIEKYNNGQSSSVRIEVAEGIMKSILYTIGIQLKTFPTPKDGVNMLKTTTIEKLYQLGRKRIDQKLKATKVLTNLMLENKLDTPQEIYNATVTEGVKGFFKIYNPNFEAHEIHITADYPVCVPINGFVGIEFMQKYVETINCENIFCRYFSSEAIHCLLSGYQEEYQYLVMNIYEKVLTTAIGCKIIGKDSRDLTISKIQKNYLLNFLSTQSVEQLKEIVLKAAKLLKNELGINAGALEKYIDKSLTIIVMNIVTAVKLNTLDQQFITAKYIEKDYKIKFSEGSKIDDELYRNVIEEIKDCRYTSDKLSIIKSEIHSMSDLEDVIRDAALSKSEIIEVFDLLNPIEIAALLKRHSSNLDLEFDGVSEDEMRFRECLDIYLSLQPNNIRSQIVKASHHIEEK